MVKLKLCSCSGQPKIKIVGDNKQYFVCICSKCGMTPLHIGEVRPTKTGTIKIWNRRVNVKKI